MNKQNFTAFVAGFILGVIILLSINPQSHVDVNMQREIQRLKTSGDSLKNVVKLSGDSLKIVVNRINLLQKERDSLAVIANSKQKRLHEIVYKTYTNSQRDSVLHSLYPSAAKGN
jgi:uncharacterized membrane-anchored protein YhcB (DUF1043 family)